MWKCWTNSPSTLGILSVLVLIEQIYSWQTFNSLGCPLMLRTNYRCVQSLNISVDVAKCVENVDTLIHYTHFWTVTKKTCLHWTIYFMARFQLISMSSYAKNKLQMCSVTQHQCRRRQMCGKCSQIHPVHSLFVRYKKRLVLIEQSIHGKVSTHSMSSYAKNKLQMCSVTQHQCRRRQMCGKCSHINSLHSLLDCYKKRLVFTEQSIHGKVSTQ